MRDPQKIDYLRCINAFCRQVNHSLQTELIYNTLRYRYNMSEIGPQGNVEGYMDYYMDVVVPHKVAVYKAGIELPEKLGVIVPEKIWIIQMLIHDLSKFSRDEMEYADWYHSKDKNKELDPYCWHHHKTRNPHHPEHWWTVSENGTAECLEMPEPFLMEMIADWTGAGKTYGNPLQSWLPENLPNFHFHERSCYSLSRMLGMLGFDTIQKDNNLYIVR